MTCRVWPNDSCAFFSPDAIICQAGSEKRQQPNICSVQSFRFLKRRRMEASKEEQRSVVRFLARPHTANLTKGCLQKFKWEVLSHPPIVQICPHVTSKSSVNSKKHCVEKNFNRTIQSKSSCTTDSNSNQKSSTSTA